MYQKTESLNVRDRERDDQNDDQITTVPYTSQGIRGPVSEGKEVAYFGSRNVSGSSGKVTLLLRFIFD